MKYYLNSNIKQIVEMAATPEFLAVEYDNKARDLNFIGYIDIYEANVPRVLFQRQIAKAELFLYNPSQNQLMVFLVTDTKASNYVSLWQITP